MVATSHRMRQARQITFLRAEYELNAKFVFHNAVYYSLDKKSSPTQADFDQFSDGLRKVKSNFSN